MEGEKVDMAVYKAQLDKVDFEICKCEQDLLKDIHEQELSLAIRDKYNVFLTDFAKNLCIEDYYNAVYDDEVEKTCIEYNDDDTIIDISPSQDKHNMHVLNNRKENQQVEVWVPPPFSIPITADVRNFDFKKLAKKQKQIRGRLFDVIVTDPPWQLATHNPTRGVALGYNQLNDDFLLSLPFDKLMDDGLIFIWVINAKYEFALKLLEKNGFELVDEIVWVKTTVNRRVARSHGFYLQHGKETCLVAKKGNPKNFKLNLDYDVLFSKRTGQSQKPTELYEIIERMVPGGFFLEVFGRRNNLRNFWTTIGNEL